jgi:hypothetical protein
MSGHMKDRPRSCFLRRVLLLLLSLCVFALQVGSPTLAQEESSDNETARTTSPRTESEGRMLRLPIQNGTVDAGELFHAVSNDLHWIAGSVTAFSRVFGGEKNTINGRLSETAVNDLCSRFPDAFRIENTKTNGIEKEELVVDIKELSKQLADKKSALRAFLAGRNGETLASLRKVPSTWTGESGPGSTAAKPLRIVVVMAGLHGIDSSAEKVAKAIHERTGLPMCVFAYPNDGPIRESAKLLLTRLERLHQQYPSAMITLVTHSMGGLVSRAALEMPDLLPGTRGSISDRTGVDQLLQVCPPNHGSALAEYGPLLEAAEQAYRLVSRSSGKRERVLFQAIVDGFNEASAELKPRSKFLQELSLCKRNPEVRYSILAGSDAPLRGGTMNLVGSIWGRISASVNEPPELGRRIESVLSCDELRKGKGDGVVSLESARLEGVKDFSVFEMHHLVWNELDTAAGKTMISEVCSRLGISL